MTQKRGFNTQQETHAGVVVLVLVVVLLFRGLGQRSLSQELHIFGYYPRMYACPYYRTSLPY